MKKYILIIFTIFAAMACASCRARDNAPNAGTGSPAQPAETGSGAEVKDSHESPSESGMPGSSAVPTAKLDAGDAAVPATETPTETPNPTMDPDTWDYVMIDGDSNMHYTESAETTGAMPYEIRVNKQMNCITVYKANKKGEYKKPVKAMACSAGRKTPLGTFHTGSKYYWKAMIHGVWAQYATRITGDILFHSVPYENHEKNTLITSYYNQLGSIASAGCIRLCVKDAKWLLENCPSGTKVTIYNSPDAGPLGKPSPKRLPSQCKWDPTDPDSRNPLHKKKSTITGVKDREVERGSSVNYLENVTAFDIHTYNMGSGGIRVSTKLNNKKPGEYPVKYTFKDSKGKTIVKKATFTVVDTSAPVISGIPEKYYVRDITKISTESIRNAVTLTDNGYPLDKGKYLTVDYSRGKAAITANDKYGHSKKLYVTVIEDRKAPVLKIAGKIKNPLPISEKVDENFARKRIKACSDDIAKLTASSPKITIRPNGWGMKISYEVLDYAGNKAAASETIEYENISVKTKTSDIPTVRDIHSDRQLEKFISVTSEETGKPVKYSLTINRTKTGANKSYKTYKVTYNVKYVSSAGEKNVSKSIKVREKR